MSAQGTYLVWRLFHHAYESADRLGDYVPTDKCHCGEVETTPHVFFNCMTVNRVWRIFDILYHSISGQHYDPMHSVKCTTRRAEQVANASRCKLILKKWFALADNPSRATLTVLLSSLLRAIDKHRYEIINKAKPSSDKIVKHFSKFIQEDIMGLFYSAFKDPSRPKDNSKRQDAFKEAFVDTGLCVINPTANTQLRVISHLSIINGALITHES